MCHLVRLYVTIEGVCRVCLYVVIDPGDLVTQLELDVVVVDYLL